MCKYCKKLKEIKDLDEKSYQKIIRKWRYHSAKQDRLLSEALDFLDPLWKFHGEMLPADVLVSVADLTWRIKYFLQQDFVGK